MKSFKQYLEELHRPPAPKPARTGPLTQAVQQKKIAPLGPLSMHTDKKGPNAI